MFSTRTRVLSEIIMNIRRGAVVLHQDDAGQVNVVYAGNDIGAAMEVYRKCDAQGVWALHESHQASRTKRFSAPAEPKAKAPAEPKAKRK